MMERTRIIGVFNDFTAERFVSEVETAVNNFGFNPEKTTKELASMSDEKQALLQQAIDSCIFALANTDRIDGRNEVAAEVCKKLDPTEDPMPELGARFLRVHPTLQQSAMSLFCCYMDQAGTRECQAEVDSLREERGSRWYRFPLI